MVNILTPRSVCGSSQKPSVSCAVLDAQIGAAELGAEMLAIASVTRRSWKAWQNASQTEILARFSTSKYLRVAL